MFHARHRMLIDGWMASSGVRNGGGRPEEASRQLYGAGGELGGDKLAGRFPVQSPYRRLLITPAKEDKEEQPHVHTYLCECECECECVPVPTPSRLDDACLCPGIRPSGCYRGKANDRVGVANGLGSEREPCSWTCLVDTRFV